MNAKYSRKQLSRQNFHSVNFGWGGSCDGYYLPDAFDLNADKYREYAEDNDDPSNMSYVYDLDILYTIYRL